MCGDPQDLTITRKNLLWASLEVWLNQIDPVAIQILEDGDRALALSARLFDKLNALLAHRPVVRGEIIGMKEKENAPARLISDRRSLFLACCARQQYVGPWFSDGPNAHPSFACGQGGIFDNFKAELFAIELLCLVILSY
jgi:hypothetical protein